MEQLKEYVRQTCEIQVKPETLATLDAFARPESNPTDDLVVNYQNVPDETVVFDGDPSESDDQ